MKFAEDQNDAQYQITGYDDQGIFINGRQFQRSVILSPMTIVDEWEPQICTQLEASHLSHIYELNPEVIILGTGENQVFPERKVLQALTSMNIGYEIMSTQAACRTFNIIMSEGRNVVAGFLIEE